MAAENAKAFADAWPAIKDALNFLRDYLGLPGVLFLGTTCWFWFEGRALKKRVNVLSDKLIETGIKSTTKLTDIGSQRLDLIGQIEELEREVRFKVAPKDRG